MPKASGHDEPINATCVFGVDSDFGHGHLVRKKKERLPVRKREGEPSRDYVVGTARHIKLTPHL